MRKLFALLTLLLLAGMAKGQSIGYLRYDTVKILKSGGNAELVLMSSTRDSLGGLLVNIGGGKTQFRRPRALNDSTLIIGYDTVIIKGGAAAGTPSLHQVTTVGDITTNGISVADDLISFTKKSSLGVGTNSGYLSLSNTGGNTAYIFNDIGFTNTEFTLPFTGNVLDTLATLFDIRTAVGAQDLQSVTDINNVTTNNIIINPATAGAVTVQNTSDVGQARLGTANFSGGYLELTNEVGSGNSAFLEASLLTGDHIYQFPDADGTLALSSDLSAQDLQAVTNNGSTTTNSVTFTHGSGVFAARIDQDGSNGRLNLYDSTDVNTLNSGYYYNKIQFKTDDLMFPAGTGGSVDTIARLKDIRDAIGVIDPQDLQSVTDIGATTTNSITTGGYDLTNGELINGAGTTLLRGKTGIDLNLGADGDAKWFINANGELGETVNGDLGNYTLQSTTGTTRLKDLVLQYETAPSAPASGLGILYTKSSNKKLYWKDDAGVEYDLINQWTTSGSDIYYTTGNVGVGVTSPTYKLQTLGKAGFFTNGSADPQLTLGDQSTGTNFVTQYDGTAGAVNFTAEGGNYNFDNQINITLDGDGGDQLRLIDPGGTTFGIKNQNSTGEIQFSNNASSTYVFDNDIITSDGHIGDNGQFTTYSQSPIFRGSSSSGANVNIQSTSHGTKGKIILEDSVKLNTLLSSTNGTDSVLCVENGMVKRAPFGYGVYTPTGTTVANITTLTLYQCQFLKVGTTVTVSGKFEVLAAATNTFTQFRLTLPPNCSSDFTAEENNAGTFLGGAANQTRQGWVKADATNDALDFYYTSGAADNAVARVFYFTTTFHIQ